MSRDVVVSGSSKKKIKKEEWLIFIEHDYLPGLALSTLYVLRHREINLPKIRQFLSSKDLNTGSLTLELVLLSDVLFL